ncbi:MAG: hypothetical protein AAF945_01230 [Actinomycetota bacterium]
MSETPTVQYRVVVAKKDERIEGPDDADVVMTVPLAAASADDFEPAVAFMRGDLKATGDPGPVLDAVRDPAASAAIAALVAAA